MTIRIAVASLIGVIVFSAAACRAVREPAAVVAGERISFDEVIAKGEAQGFSADNMKSSSAMAYVVNTMVREILVRNELDRLDVEVSNADETDALKLLQSQVSDQAQLEALVGPQAELIALSYALSGGRPTGDITAAFLAERGDDVVCATVVQTIDRTTADTVLQQLRDGAAPDALAAAAPNSVAAGAGCGVVGDGSVPEAFETALTSVEVGEISNVIEIPQNDQMSYSILVRVEPNAQNVAGLAEQASVTTATESLTGFLAEADVTISTRIGRWAKDTDGSFYGAGIYGVLPNDPPAVDARPAAPTTTQSVLEQLSRP